MRNIPGLGRVWYSGDAKGITIDVYDESGVLKDITGTTAKFLVFDGEDMILTKEVTGITGTSVNVAFAPADTAGLGGTSFQVLQYECEVTDAGGNVSTVARGLFTITADLIP